LKDQIQRAMPGVKVYGAFGRRSSFEITINDQIVFSKLQQGAFPNNTQLLEAIKHFSQTGEIIPVQPRSGGCIIA
jgi:selenoprotein W-related protein